MDKIIKEIKDNGYTYKLGYSLYHNLIYPRIEIHKLMKGEKFVYDYIGCGGIDFSGMHVPLFFAIVDRSSSTAHRGDVNTIKKIFRGLRKVVDVPIEVEEEFENIFLLYKLNNFKEI